jgi:hypothetical protein
MDKTALGALLRAAVTYNTKHWYQRAKGREPRKLPTLVASMPT